MIVPKTWNQRVSGMGVVNLDGKKIIDNYAAFGSTVWNVVKSYFSRNFQGEKSGCWEGGSESDPTGFQSRTSINTDCHEMYNWIKKDVTFILQLYLS